MTPGGSNTDRSNPEKSSTKSITPGLPPFVESVLNSQDRPIIMESIPVRSFRGKTGENINVFLADLEVHYMPKDECYITQAQKNAAKLALLRSKLKGRASTFVLRQPPAISGSWEELIAVLKKKYDRQPFPKEVHQEDH
ncbi:uncharacterized protein LAJ45_05208 [Morchella importuna]|uniref:uncharacterized protein n=1 Tax=Morchella importuna TaxID=1174673 RepID=UPI001E8EC900|nr:uncharacterized protein LAJ45_05208 [Morchella importuna]KAH8150513.1 hypothetical protein LAJ45_05208 [Morchella importuna]